MSDILLMCAYAFVSTTLYIENIIEDFLPRMKIYKQNHMVSRNKSPHMIDITNSTNIIA